MNENRHEQQLLDQYLLSDPRDVASHSPGCHCETRS